MIEGLWPVAEVGAVELFRRGPARVGWDVLGDEAT